MKGKLRSVKQRTQRSARVPALGECATGLRGTEESQYLQQKVRRDANKCHRQAAGLSAVEMGWDWGQQGDLAEQITLMVKKWHRCR